MSLSPVTHFRYFIHRIRFAILADISSTELGLPSLQASVIMENVKQVVTCQGVAFIDIPSRSWSELPHEPGNWTLSHELENSQPAKTSYREWLHLYDSSSVVVSINQVRMAEMEMDLFGGHGASLFMRLPHIIYTGWRLVVWNMFYFFHILGIIIPTDNWLSYFSEG